VFYLRGLIERWGRGTQKIVELCVQAGHPEPEFEERTGEVVVRFIRSGYIGVAHNQAPFLRVGMAARASSA
jgi:ATP-dependent DNA helicase RecG